MSENNGGGAILTAEAIKARGRREVELPSGGKVVVQRIGVSDLAAIMGHLPDVSVLAAMQDGNPNDVAKRPEAAPLMRAMNSMLLAGVIIPKLYEDPQAGPTPRDFPFDEQVLLFTEILDVSGFTKAAGGKVLPLSRTAG